jgi:hypothetical protein
MRSDFAGARMFLERAFDCLKDADATSQKMREAIDLLIEVAMKEEVRREDAKILPFRRVSS